MNHYFYNIREFITIQKNIIVLKSKDVYLPIGPLNYTVIKIFNFADHEFVLHSNSKRDLIYSSLYAPRQGIKEITIYPKKYLILTYFFDPDLKIGCWNLTMN